MSSLDPRGGHNRYEFNKDFFKKWTPEMAYVLGFMYADGNITNAVSSRTQYTHFYSSDKEILEKIKHALSAKHPLEVILPKTRVYKNGVYTSKTGFRLRIGSRELYEDLVKLGLTPKKSLTITFPTNVPYSCFRHFIRGYFDGDGCVYIKKGYGKYQQKILKGLSVIFTSGSKLFLEGLKANLSVKGFHSGRIYVSAGAFQLRYSTAESVNLFSLFYGELQDRLFLERKFNKFIEYFNLRPIRKP